VLAVRAAHPIRGLVPCAWVMRRPRPQRWLPVKRHHDSGGELRAAYRRKSELPVITVENRL
jgi:hypothetical protein